MRCAWNAGQKVVKAIGFDSTEDHRTYSDGGNLSVCPEKGLPVFGERYTCIYPLREWGYNRQQCGEIIKSTGLWLPPKSACFFCPAMRDIEIQALAVTDPDLFVLALEMERLYRGGKHFRGDNRFTVIAKHKLTKERLEWDTTAVDVGSAREQFRRVHNDTVRPYQWDLKASRAVVGLSRDRAWANIVTL